MRPRVGKSKPAISRRQVVLPEPDGPSIEKNSPSRTAKLTSETASIRPELGVTKLRVTCSSSIAALTRVRPASASAHDGDVVGDPLAIGHAGAFGAFPRRRAPEMHLVEAIEPVDLAGVCLARRRFL